MSTTEALHAQADCSLMPLIDRGHARRSDVAWSATRRIDAPQCPVLDVAAERV